jgi:hypothetical protein
VPVFFILIFIIFMKLTNVKNGQIVLSTVLKIDLSNDFVHLFFVKSHFLEPSCTQKLFVYNLCTHKNITPLLKMSCVKVLCTQKVVEIIFYLNFMIFLFEINLCRRVQEDLDPIFIQ